MKKKKKYLIKYYYLIYQNREEREQFFLSVNFFSVKKCPPFPPFLKEISCRLA